MAERTSPPNAPQRSGSTLPELDDVLDAVLEDERIEALELTRDR